jgi:Mlc titration factor MtfA (ptsG expression regulator)
MEFLIVAALGLLLASWFAGEPLLVAWRRGRLRRQAFPAAWRATLRRRMPYFSLLPADLQLQLKRHMQVFLAEKRFVGCAGLVVTDEMRVTIAAQACLLLLNRRTDYFARLREILVYPGRYVARSIKGDGSGLLHEGREARSGESWAHGQVVLSWDDVLDGAAVPDDGRNLVIHEFAHQLDQEKGHANGAPWLGGAARRRRWSQVLGAAYARLQAQVRERAWAAPASQDTSGAVDMPLIDAYGASDPAEFFAVVSEVFFEQPRRLAAEDPDLYREFRAYYRVDPLSW